MEPIPISQDDIQDVTEMTGALEEAISAILNGNQSSLALSALMGASINCMMSQCKTLNEVIYYRNIFITALDGAISLIQIKNPNE